MGVSGLLSQAQVLDLLSPLQPASRALLGPKKLICFWLFGCNSQSFKFVEGMEGMEGLEQVGRARPCVVVQDWSSWLKPSKPSKPSRLQIVIDSGASGCVRTAFTGPSAGFA